ncbi:hypothetical protein MMC24_004820 [Lignoscripta atroalba]|nr:hypothetical protein [Lignoscripta atroalba]
MYAKYIVTIVTFAIAATASPIELEKRTTPAEEAQISCGNNFKASCCNQITKTLFGLIPINVGLGCTALNLLSVLPINQVCTQQVACCQSGAQYGLVNVGNVCPVVL